MRGGGKQGRAGDRQVTRQSKAAEQQVLMRMREVLAEFTEGDPAGSGAAPPNTRRETRAAKDMSLLGALRRVIDRASEDDDTRSILTQIMRLADAAEAGRGAFQDSAPPDTQAARKPASKAKSQPASKAKSKASPKVKSLPAAARQTFYGRPPAKAKSPSTPTESQPFAPSKLFDAHWHGTVVDASTFINRYMALSKEDIDLGTHLVGGVFDDVPPTLLSANPPSGCSFTVIARADFEGSRPVTCPCQDPLGRPRICHLHSRTWGAADTSPLKWAAQTGKPLPAAPESAVIRLTAFKAYLPPAEWQRISADVTSGAKAWLRSLSVPQADVVDLFRDGSAIDQSFSKVNVRVAVKSRDLILAASGVKSILAKELPKDNQVTDTAGTVAWQKQLPTESGAEFLTRALAVAEAAEPCLGLAFSNTGSIGVRMGAKAAPTGWRADGATTLCHN